MGIFYLLPLYNFWKHMVMESFCVITKTFQNSLIWNTCQKPQIINDDTNTYYSSTNYFMYDIL
jgi:hypothetical protein